MKKTMLVRRIILAAIIIGSGVFASFFGGAARSVFYTLLLVPLLSLIYTFYVYLRFRIYQNVEYKAVVKGEKTPYYFVLSNEDFISYTDVRVTFLEDFSLPQNMELCRSYYLSPDDKIERHTEILCRYRGEYCVGVRDVIVTDPLGVFSIKYPAPSVISMSVLPKIPKLDKLTLAPVDCDAKLVRFSRGSSSEPPDCEMRKYSSGDRIKLINWRASAKCGELLVRQNSDTQNNGILFVLDLSENKTDDYSRIIIEDKIIESALAATNYLVGKNVPVTVVYEQGEIHKDLIFNSESFNEFYGKCGGLNFTGRYSPEQIGSGIISSVGGEFVIFAVHSLSRELCALCNGISELGGDVAILLVGGEDELSGMLDSRIIFRRISLTDEITDVLGGTYEH